MFVVVPGFIVNAPAIAGAVGGAMVNAVAGGGMLLVYPVLLGLGYSSIVANATATAVLMPGTLGSLFGYRRSLEGLGGWLKALVLPSVAGGCVGAGLLAITPPARFAWLAPILILAATALFAAQPYILERLKRGQTVTQVPGVPSSRLLAAQFLICIYVGYFGPGAGVLMLAMYEAVGFRNLHQMNAFKNWCGTLSNTTALVVFQLRGLVDWHAALPMMVAATIAGWVTATFIQRVSSKVVRPLVIALGVASAVWLVRGR